LCLGFLPLQPPVSPLPFLSHLDTLTIEPVLQPLKLSHLIVGESLYPDILRYLTAFVRLALARLDAG
jgi:hypothetical protein